MGGARKVVNVAVFVKYVPDPQGTPELGPDNLLMRGPDGALDPGDEYGVEMGLRLAGVPLAGSGVEAGLERLAGGVGAGPILA